MTSTPSDHTRFHVRFGDIEMEVSGDRALVERTVERMNPAIEALLNKRGDDSTPAEPPRPRGLVVTAEAPLEETAAPPSLEERMRTWYENHVVLPEGKRGMKQDHALLFIWFFTNPMKQEFATTNDVRVGFETLGMKEPNIAVLMHTLKGKNLIEPAEAYASYSLTEQGRLYVEGRFELVKKL